MSEPKVVSIGGVDYDSHSGLPLQSSQTPVAKRHVVRTPSVSAKGVHQTHQRSAALNRQFVKKSVTIPAQHATPIQKAVTNRPKQHGRVMDMRPTTKRSPQITRFAATPTIQLPAKVAADNAPVAHPLVAKAHAARPTSHTHSVKTVTAPQTSRDIKHAELGKALLNATPNTKTPKKPQKRGFSIAAASLGLVLVAGYFTYVNLPNLSVRVAAAQAGIDASFPEYRPVGYHINGPVAYKNGEVSINFSSNSGPLAFSLSQARSSWDSSALLEKFVSPESDGKYATYNDGGLTIYTYGTDAAWINGGILYTVDGSATLSNEQIRRIATSM